VWEETIILLVVNVCYVLYTEGGVVWEETIILLVVNVYYVLYTERGVVWEETIILLPDNVHYVFLSATIPNATQFAEWISYLHKQVK